MVEKRQNAERREQIDELLEMKEDIKKLVSLLNEMEGFFGVIVKVGRIFKWTLGLATACFAAYAAWLGIYLGAERLQK